MRKLSFFVCLLIGCICIAEMGLAQSSKKFKNANFKRKNKRISSWTGGKTGGMAAAGKYGEIGISLNAMNYFGDLAPAQGRASFDISFTRPGFGIYYTKKLSSRIFARGQFLYGRVRGSDESASEDGEDGFRRTRNLQFRNTILELTAVGQIYLFPNSATSSSRPIINPYLFAGIGVIRHNPQGQVPDVDREGNALANAGEWVDLEPLGTEGQNFPELYPEAESYSLIQLVVPAGVGVTYAINDFLDLSFEVGYRHLFFDHLYDVGGDYANHFDVGQNDPVAGVMSDRSYLVGETRDNVPVFDPATGEIVSVNNIVPGYGHINGNELRNPRGDTNDRSDIYIVTAFQLSYILGGKTGRAKFR
jgi:hypothetical protein